MVNEQGEPKTLEEKQKKFYDTLTWYFSEKRTPTGFFHTIGLIRDRLTDLNKNLENANKSSAKLTRALNKITLWGVIVASIGVLVALGALIFRIYEYVHLH